MSASASVSKDGHHNDEQDSFSSYTYSGASEGLARWPLRTSAPLAKVGKEKSAGCWLNIARGSAGRYPARILTPERPSAQRFVSGLKSLKKEGEL